MSTDVSASTWDDVRSTVERALRDLPERGFVTLREPGAPAERRRGLLGALGARTTPPSRFVQALRIDDTLMGECVGAESFGGLYPIDAETDARLRALGWAAPGDEGWVPDGIMMYQHSEPATTPAGPADLAGLMVTTLATLGLTPTGPLVLTVDG